MTSSEVDFDDDVSLQGKVFLIVLSQACERLLRTPPLRLREGSSALTQIASLTPPAQTNGSRGRGFLLPPSQIYGHWPCGGCIQLIQQGRW